mmetsp:Transcript_8427/g.9525  ORF Transcript_8427/g.9525 Transcript_8427/m.9525 type:complete len:199 (+) Transcript_8427:45-641(+)|eukprot:CAMPEP_0176436584 /NCGR_PEP_ID=MMETSP0127-20121128/18062_1 /TAXON_ID=938130 /ORGANISM="Platyophrya macrostoma, Strain WH" /LENGTH=198 /DNA_ID=CAMNT_0017819945 /DNA_START=42 /DNA_END=638 /DNA_ORIENTATION=-
MATTLCKVFLMTGNCPVLESCKQEHPQKKPQENKLRKKLGKPKAGNEFVPTTSETETKKTEPSEEQTTTESTTKSEPLEETKVGEKKEGEGAKKKLKLPTKSEEFKVSEGTDAKEFMQATAMDYDDSEVYDEVHWDEGSDDMFAMDRDPMTFHEPSKNCSCCKGHIYNCDGEICQNLESCFCYALEEDEQAYQESRNM